jgi:Tol biopolymer transport system component
MVYVVEGNLYLQNESNPPRQLTDSGEDGYPILSDDGEKIMFFRGDMPRDLYVINAEGSQEQALVTNEVLVGLGYGELTEVHDHSWVPDTHRLLFNTLQLNAEDVKSGDPNSRNLAKVNRDLLLVDADTGEIQSLVPPGKGGRFWVSPDGSRVAIVKQGEVLAITIDGQVVHQGRVPFAPGLSDIIWDVFWTPDAANLILLVPTQESLNDEMWPPTYTVWRYPLDESPPIQVPLDPPPMDIASVSPDGNWIIYSYYPEGRLSRQAPLYVGNLRQGHAELYAPDAAILHWSPDSTHFVYGYGQLFLGTVEGPPTLIDEGRFLGWVDAGRYLYFYTSNGAIMMGELGGRIVSISTGVPRNSLLSGPNWFTFILMDRRVEEFD